MSALDDLILTLEHRHNIKLDTERNELADLRARALPQAVADAVRAYQESYLTLQGLKGVDERRKIEWQRSKGHRDAGTKRALLDAIEADAKGGG